MLLKKNEKCFHTSLFRVAKTNKYISTQARFVADILLIEARKGIRPPVMMNVKIIQFTVPRRNKFDLPPGVYRKVVEE